MPLAASPPASQPPSSGVSRPPDPRGVVPLWRSGVILFLAVFMLVVTRISSSAPTLPQSGVVMSLPNVIDAALPDRANVPFYGTKQPISEGELGILPADTEFVRKQYDDIRDHESVLCTLLLSGAEQRSIHRPEVCLPGQGWTIVGQDNVPIPLASGHNLVVRNLTIQRDVVSQNGQHHTIRAFYMYWFVGQNLTTPSQYMRVLLNSWDRVLYNHAHRWAYIMVMSPVSGSFRSTGLNDEQTKTMMTDFIRQAVPSFQKSEMPDQASH